MKTTTTKRRTQLQKLLDAAAEAHADYAQMKHAHADDLYPNDQVRDRFHDYSRAMRLLVRTKT